MTSLLSASRLVARGFSLVELLVVIAVVAVLMAVLLPSLSAAREQTRRAVCSSNQRQLMIASHAYSVDFKGYAPDAKYSTYGRYCVDTDLRKLLYTAYGLSNPAVWWCPSSYDKPGFRRVMAQEPWFMDETSGSAPWGTSNRAMTYYGYFAGPGRGKGAAYDQEEILRFDRANQPSTRIVWADNLKLPTGPFGGTGWTFPSNTHSFSGSTTPDGALFAMADGHAEWREYRPTDNLVEWRYQYFMFKP